MKLSLLKHKRYKMWPWNFVDRIITRPLFKGGREFGGLIAFFRLRDAKRHLAELEKIFKVDYEIVEFEDISGKTQ